VLILKKIQGAAKLTKETALCHQSSFRCLFSKSALKISIIIVHFFGEEHLKNCLDSIPLHPSISELVIVDNGSNEGFTERISGSRTDLTFLSNEKNIGYGAAVNKGAQAATGDILLVLNQDIILHEDTLTELIRSVEQHGNVSIWGAQLQNARSVEQGSVGPFPTLFNWIMRLFKPKGQRKYYSSQPNAGSQVDWATGAFLAIRSSSFNTLNGFDENYFMYYEDVDLCKRAEGIGHITVISSAMATHSSPISERHDVPPELLKAIRQGQLRYFNEHRPKWEFAILLIVTRGLYFLNGWKWRSTYL